MQTSQTPLSTNIEINQTISISYKISLTPSSKTNPNMFRVELLPDKGSAPAPGYTYVADRSFASQSARAPALSRKRGIRDAGKGGDISSRQANAIAKHIAELDRENKRDTSIPIPVKQPSSRGARTKTTSNTRRILQSQKTFRNHLDDEEAAINNAATGVSTPSGNAALAVNKGNKALAVSAAARRSSTPATPAVKDVKKRGAAVISTPTPAPSVGTPVTTGTDVEMEDEDEERKHKLLKTEHDDDPLLRSYGPTMPSDRVLQRLLAEPPLSYNAARAAPSGKLSRHFCCVCGYWGKIPCKTCHSRTCGLDCYRLHEDSRCGAFY